jgi:hypothetical protein
MKFFRPMSVLFLCALVAGLFLSACKDAGKTEKMARLEISGVEYNVRQTHENSYVLDVRGKIKNVGDVDVKKAVVTGYCRSCVLAFTSHRWFTSDCDKTETQKDTISYLPAGAEEEFSFEEVAFYFTHEKVRPENLPENIEVVIESYEIAG